MLILIVEDEPKIASFLSQGFREEGHTVEVATDLALARAACGPADFNMLIVDRMLPDGDGMALVEELRAKGDGTPAICLTARGELEDKVEALRGGADDYLVKPFLFEELLARIEAVQRRSGRVEPRLEIGDLVIDVVRHRAWRAARELELTPTEYSLLHALASNAGKPMTRAELLKEVWGVSGDPGTNVVDVYISYLRGKVDEGHPRRLIQTIRGVGYSLDAAR
jgi:two-component system, OmpR family, response regulator